MPEQTITLELNSDELTSIRVAMLHRMDRLAGHESYGLRADLQESYNKTRDLMNGKLWDARRDLSEKLAGNRMAANALALHQDNQEQRR